jgi:O-6-methylguanine DNA methyltransferase
MIRGLVDFALNNRWLVVGLAILLFGWGMVSFHNLPVEAYPDVANNYVQIITQWPGRAAEEVEQQVTVPLEIQMAGIPHMTHLRSTSLAGLSSLTLIFDDDSINDWNREKVVERLSQVTLPAGLQPADRYRLEPSRADLLVHVAQHEPSLRQHGPQIARGLDRRGRDPSGLTSAMKSYFDGEVEAIQSLPVSSGGTSFQQSVWQVLRLIPSGETISYGGLAKKLGKPTAVRAVGLANGANPISIVVPCHRVIGADGSLTGYGGGLHRKRWLLDHERKHRTAVDGVVDLKGNAKWWDRLDNLEDHRSRYWERRGLRSVRDDF